MQGQTFELKPVLVQDEAQQVLTLPSLPRFTDLAQQFLGNLPDLLRGGGADKGGDPATTYVPRITW